jgi:glycine dehydrogenase subunit 1
MKYAPNPPAVVKEMLDSIGLNHIDDLFQDIPKDLKVKDGLDLPAGIGEMELREDLRLLAAKNISSEEYPCFLGAGAYDHYIPAALEQLLLRSEFYTSYTPYQPEISQGVLQSIFEYQTMICRLTGMDVSNASVYDGGSALAEACNLACLSSKRKKVLIPDTVHPEYIEILKTYAISGLADIMIIPGKNGAADIDGIIKLVDQETAAVVLQQPNFYGNLEDLTGVEKAVHKNKGLLIMAVDPISLAVLKSPGEWGADIAVGEGQSLGNSLSFGGPYLGFLASTKRLMRKLPGRIVGQTVDINQQRAFVLTLQAREQHIRREKAGSNLCSNQALNALTATIYLTLIGNQGLQAIAARSHQLAVYAAKEIAEAGLSLKYQAPFFREFAVKVDNPGLMNARLLENGIIGGYELEDALLLAFTEKRKKSEIDRLAAVLGGGK